MANNERAAETELEAIKSKIASMNSGERFSVGPFGRMIPRRKFVGLGTYKFKDPNEHLAFPERLLANPEPGMHYAWPIADSDETKGKLRDGHYIKVTMEELDQHTRFAIKTHTGTSGGKDVRWFGHVLVKIPPLSWAELYEDPVEYSKDRLDQESEAFQDKVTTVSRGVAKPMAEIGVDTGQA